MKKVIVALVMVVLAILLLSPLYGGKKAQSSLDDLVAHVNATAPGSAEWASYDQGWFTSNAVLLVNLSAYLGLPETTDEAAILVPLQLDLHHGPIVMDENLELGWFKGRWYLDDEHEAWVKEHIQVEGEGPFFVSTFKMAMTGVVAFKEETLPFSVTTEDGLFSVEGYAGEGVYRPFGTLSYQGGFASARLLTDDGNIVFEGAEVAVISDLHERYGQFAVPGEASFSLQKVAMVEGEDTVVALRDLSFFSSFVITQQDPAASDVSFKISLGDAELMGETISDAVVEVALQRMSVAFYNQYMQQLQAAHEGGNASLLGMQLLSLVNKELLPLGPELQLKEIGFSAPEGQLLISGYLRVPEEATPQQANPFALVGKIKAQLDILVDKPLAYKLAEQSMANSVDEETFASGVELSKEAREATIKDRAATQLDMLLLQGFLVDKGDKFATQMSFQDGVAVVNEQTIPLPF